MASSAACVSLAPPGRSSPTTSRSASSSRRRHPLRRASPRATTALRRGRELEFARSCSRRTATASPASSS
jgi:hypothetical protein